MSFVFYLEITLRAYAYHPTFYQYVVRNILDTGVIVCMFCSEIHGLTLHRLGWTTGVINPHTFSVVRVVRVFRLVRILRSPLLLRLSRRLRVFIASFEDSFPSLLWALFFLFMIN